MNKPYLIMVNGVLAARHVSRLGAMRHIEKLALNGIRAVIAYQYNGGK